jgi:hypothetical protein
MRRTEICGGRAARVKKRWGRLGLEDQVDVVQKFDCSRPQVREVLARGVYYAGAVAGNERKERQTER